MKIKFKEPDPRAGTIAQMDSSRGQHFIDSGAAVLVRDDGRVESSVPTAPAVTRADLDRALSELPGDNVDAEYVVGAMRSHFGELFTGADEARVRDVVKAPAVTRADLDRALSELPGDNVDAEYVVGAMRSHFGELFTGADEARVRDVVKAPAEIAGDNAAQDQTPLENTVQDGGGSAIKAPPSQSKPKKAADTKKDA